MTFTYVSMTFTYVSTIIDETYGEWSLDGLSLNFLFFLHIHLYFIATHYL